MTPVESNRLRDVSYERQLARGSARPGYAGLVAERFGDSAPYEHRSSNKPDGRNSEENVQLRLGMTSSTDVDQTSSGSRV
jgi:hypothetical protein